MRPVRLRRSLKCLFASLLLTVSLAQSTPISVRAQSDDPALLKSMSLLINALSVELALGDVIPVTLIATNTGLETVEGVSLHLHDISGILWGEDFKEPWLELGDLKPGESRVIATQAKIEGLPADGALLLAATLQGNDVQPAEATAELLVKSQPAEESDVSSLGDIVEAADGRIRFTSPKDWHESDALLAFQLQEQFKHASGDFGRLLQFSVEASTGTVLVDVFDAPVKVEIALIDLVDLDWTAKHLPVVSTRKSADVPWTAVESTFDPKTGRLSFETTHFSEFQATTEPQLWQLLYNPPGTSLYSGAATYQYPLELPPGIGGLTPDLTLTYSSRPAEGMEAPAMSHGFGAGWGLPQAQINNGNTGGMYLCTISCKAFQNYNFTLVLNGITYYLQILSTSGERYHGTY